MSDDSKDTGEKQWPEIQLAIAPDWWPHSTMVLAANEAAPAWTRGSERYLPLHTIRERLTSDEAIEAAAAEIDSEGRSSRGALEFELVEAVEAAIAVAFPAEEEQDRAEG